MKEGCYMPNIIGSAHPKAEPNVKFVSVWAKSNQSRVGVDQTWPPP
jgi:hypothetical protein